MGNCQAAEAATVEVQHPGGNKVDRICWSASANEVMGSNPGYYVAQVVASPAAKTEDGRPVKQLKLLRPDDTMVVGQVYRLVSFEDVLKEFSAKKCVKLGKLLKEGGALSMEHKQHSEPTLNSQSASVKTEGHHLESGGGGGGGRPDHGLWKPALPSISELGT